jgi:hypothetical protein
MCVWEGVEKLSQWPTEFVNHPRQNSCIFCPYNLIVRRSAQSIQKVFSTSSWFQNPIAIKPCIRIVHMSNQRRAESVNENFGIQSYWEGHDKISSKSWFRPEGPSCLEFWFSKLVNLPIVVTRKSLIVWCHIMDHRKGERVSYHNGIRYFGSFGQSETRKLSLYVCFCILASSRIPRYDLGRQTSYF